MVNEIHSIYIDRIGGTVTSAHYFVDFIHFGPEDFIINAVEVYGADGDIVGGKDDLTPDQEHEIDEMILDALGEEGCAG